MIGFEFTVLSLIRFHLSIALLFREKDLGVIAWGAVLILIFPLGVQGLGFGVRGSGLKVSGISFRVQGLGLRVEG